MAGVSEVVGSILLVGITVLLVAAYWLATQDLRTGRDHDPVVSGGYASFWDDGYWVSPTGPDNIPLKDSKMVVSIDGVETTVPLGSLPGLAGHTSWDVGTRLCIIGPDPSCYRATGGRVEVTVLSRLEYVFSMSDLLVQTPPFHILNNGGGVIVTTTQPVRIDNIGSAVTCGAGGPRIPVTARLTQDGGATYSILFGGAVLNPNGGETVTLPAVPVAANLGIEATFSGGGCSAVVRHSVPAEPQVLVLRAGDSAPDKAPYAGQAPLEGFLQPYVNTYTQTMVLDTNQVILLFEIVSDVSSSAADFQDLVILFTFGG
ncbi:MAG: hypothetical protein QOC71_1271 [Thermoplasmata archaeon]|nr:hypothetical protein [Thermoplasmata archaeon]